MRYASLAAVALAVSTLAPSALLGQISSANLSIVNYQLVSEVPDTRDTSFFIYRASLLNVGPALPSITATAMVQFSQTLVVVPGMGNLHFPPAARFATVDSLNTFTILMDRRDNFSFNQLLWSYNAPVANAGPDQTAATKAVVTLNGSGSTNPSGIGTLTYSWAFATVPLGSAATITNPTSVTPTFVPDILGIYTIALTVSNGAGTDTSTVNVNVNTNAPPPPVADAGPNQAVVLGATVHLDGSKSKDFNGNPLTYSWTLVQRPGGSTAVLTGANTVSPTFVADVATMPPPAVPYIAQLVVNDGTRSSPPAMVTITTGITQPVANAGPNQSVTTGATVQLDGSKSTDANSLPLTYRWSLISLPSPTSTAKLSNPNVVNPTFVADLAGMYIAQLIVNNGTFDSTASTVTITANPQQIQKPIANAGSAQTVQIGAAAATPVVLTGSGSDPQSLPLTFHWTLTVPPGSNTTLSNPSLATTTFVPDKLGQYVATLTVNNGTLNSDPSSVTITVTDTQPVANPGPPQNVTVGGTVTLDGSASTDFNHAPLTYRWSLTLPAGSGAILNGANTVSPTFVPDVAGTYVAQLIVNDGFQDSVPQTVTITASIVVANTITLSPNPLHLVGNPGTLTVTLGAAAGGSGQVVTLSGLDPTIATAPPSVTVLAGALSAAVTITPHQTGTTFITASAPGFRPDFGEIDVVPGLITLTLSSSNVGVGNTVTGTITLNSPAPASGVTVGLSLDKNGFVSLSTTSVTIPSGGTTGTFTVTGGPINAGGPTIITASANGYTSGTAPITSGIRGSISLPTGLTVAPSQTLPIVVSVDQPVTGNPVTITLGSSDTNRLTITPPTVTIPVGSTTANAQVTGVNFGSANITATANGFLSATQAVSVAASLSFPPATVTVGAGSTANLILTLSAPAPTGGVVVNLVSDTPSVATVPSTVTIPGTQTTATVVVTGVKAGNAKITASSSTTGISSATANILVVNVLAIQSNALPAGVVGTPYASFSETASGGTTPYTFSATGLPAGLSINSGSGAITGTPTTAGGPSPVTITVTDSTIPTPSTASTTGLTITIVSPLTITSNALPGGTVGTAYTAPAQLVGGGTSPYTYTVTGLPAGLSISSTTGVITGTPTAAAASAPVTITATDSTNPTHLTVSTTGLTISIGGSPLTITSNALPGGTVGTVYAGATEPASGGLTPYTYTATGLPAGLSINAGTGAISGTPTAATAGAVPVTVTVTDSTLPTHQTASTTGLTINITSGLTIPSNALPNGIVGTVYAGVTESASGGTTPYTYTATGLPAGLSINAGTGAISGTPTAATAGAVPVTVTVTDSTLPTHQTASTTGLTINILPATLAITSNQLSSGVVGVPYSTTTQTVTGGTTPYTFTASGLPAGLSINAGSGAISGTPSTATGSPFSVIIMVTDSSLPTHQTASTTPLSLNITSGLVITNNPLPNGIVGTAYTAGESANGGIAPVTYAATGLPAGLSINAGTGAISGTPTTAAGSPFSVTITATDSTLPTHQTASTSGLTITIISKLTITNTALPAGMVGTAYSASETASGGTTPVTYTATGLPGGLVINAGSGAISGTPTTAAGSPFSVTITATDSTLPTHQTASTSGLTITIAPTGVTITSNPLPNGVVGTAYTATSQTVNGGTVPYTFTATGLPAGLSITAGTGVISGTPTTATGSPFSVVITATDSTLPTHLTASTNILTLNIAPTTLTITSNPLQPGQVGTAYTATSQTVNGGTVPYTFTATGLPAGLSINAGTGVISGTPTTATGSPFSVVITATDSTLPTHLTASTNILTLNIAPTTLTITSTALQTGQVGIPYSTTTQVANGGTTPYTFTATGLPAGLVINAGTGAISGTPTADTLGNFVPVTITVTDSTVPTHLTASTTGLTIKIIPASLILTKAVLVDGTVGVAYIDTVTAAGGNKPYIWSIQGLPPGLFVNSGNGQISGIPGPQSENPYNLIVTVKDSSTPQLTTTGSVLLDIRPPTPTATVTGGTVGQRLLVPITISLSEGSVGGACQSGLIGCVVLTSSNPNIVAVAGRQFDVGSATAKSDTAVGQTSVVMYAVGIANSGSVTLTASIQGFVTGMSTVTASPSGFMLAGPNGVGSSFIIGANSSTPLTVTSVQLDASGNVGQAQALAHQPGQSLVIDPNTGQPIPSVSGPPVAVSLTPGAGIGTVTPSTVTLTTGTSSATTTFTAGSTAVASTITLNSSTACVQTTDGNGSPNGCVIGTFVTPAGGASVLPVSVSNLVLSCTAVTVGQNLENSTFCKLNGAAPAALTINLTSNDPSKLLFAPLNAFGAPDPTALGVSHVAMSIPAGFSSTAAFYVYGVGNTGTVTYLADAGGGITGTGNVTLAKSGFVLVTPFGTGADFPATAPSSTDLTVQTAVLDSGGNYVGTQGLAGGLTASVNVTSSNNSVGTISGSPAMITAANNSAIVQLLAAAQGTTTITAATPAGFTTPAQGNTVLANVTQPRLRILTGNNSVGNNLELSGLITINVPAGPTGVTVNLSITGSAALSATGTDAGAPNIAVTIPPNSFSTTFYIYGKDVQGTATVSASSPGFTSFNQLEQLTPSGVIVLGPLGQNNSIPWDINLSNGNQPFTVATAQLDATGRFVQQQPLAGANPLTVTLNDSVSSVGTVPDSISISPGAVANGTANAQFHPLTTGNTAVSTVAPTGFTTPVDGTNMLTVRVH